MGDSDKESKKGYLSMYEKGVRGINRCKMLIDEISRWSKMPFIPLTEYEDQAMCDESVKAEIKDLGTRIQKYESMCAQVSASVEELEGAEREVATLRYIDGLTWEDIAEKVGYSVGNIHRIHNRALENVALH